MLQLNILYHIKILSYKNISIIAFLFVATIFKYIPFSGSCVIRIILPCKWDSFLFFAYCPLSFTRWLVPNKVRRTPQPNTLTGDARLQLFPRHAALRRTPHAWSPVSDGRLSMCFVQSKSWSSLAFTCLVRFVFPFSPN